MAKIEFRIEYLPSQCGFRQIYKRHRPVNPAVPIKLL